MEVVVLGAGALGCASAYHLAAAGHRVTVVESVQVAGRTTGLAAGILSLALVDPNDRWLTLRTMEGLEALAAAHPAPGADVGPLLHRPGSHLLAAPGDEARVVARIAEGLAAMGVAHERLTPQEWQEEMAGRGLDARPAGVDHVLSLPTDAWALSTEASTLMMRAARAAGARFVQGEAQRLRVSGDTVTGVQLADGRVVQGERTVVALGAWSRGFLEQAGLRLPAQGYRTHAAILRTPLARAAPIVHDNAGCYYFRPESTQHLLVGDGTRTDATSPEGFTNEAEPSFLEDIAARVPARFPRLEEAQLQNSWRGILTGIPDKRPLLGPHPDRRGLWLCTGGNGFGFMRSYSLGACLAASIDGREPDGLPDGILRWMDPERFWPDPPSAFPVMEGFQLLPPSHGRAAAPQTADR